MLRDLPNWVLLIGVVAFVAIVGAWAYWQRLKRRTVWQRFARRYRLPYREMAPGKPLVAGRLGPWPLKLAMAESGSDQGGAYVTIMSLGLQKSAPDIEVHQGGLIGSAEKLLEGDIVATDDAEFDRLAVVRGSDATAIRNYLTADRRAALSGLLSHSGNYQAGLEGGNLFIESRHLVTRLRDLEVQLKLLKHTAERLEA